MKFELDTSDLIMVAYCFILVAIGGIFLGSEIETIKRDAEVRHNQKIINNCNKLIAGSLYDK